MKLFSLLKSASRSSRIRQQKAVRARRPGLLDHVDFMDGLEKRQLLAAFSYTGSTVTLDLNVASQIMTIASTGTTYTFTLSGGATNTWTGTAGSGLSASGATLTASSTALSTFNLFNIGDSANGTGVTFGNSGANTYQDNLNITLNSNSSAVLFSGTSSFAGSNNLTILTDSRVELPSASSLTMANGSLSMDINTQATPQLLNFSGLMVNNATIQTTGSGLTTIVARGGVGAGASFLNKGVAVVNGGKISGGTTGTLSITGYGYDNYALTSATQMYGQGVFVSGTNASNTSLISQITSLGANVSVTGYGANDTNANLASISANAITNAGVVVGCQTAANPPVVAYGLITSGGNGTVTVTGYGGSLADQPVAPNINVDRAAQAFGVLVYGSSATIKSGGAGLVNVQGFGGGATANTSWGVGVAVMQAANITSGTNGSVAVFGAGCTTANAQYQSGVYLWGGISGPAIIAAGPGTGSTSVTGNGGSCGTSGGSSHGVYLNSNATITALGSGNVNVTGWGGASPTGTIAGINMYGTNQFDSAIKSGGGNVVVTGYGGEASGPGTNFGGACGIWMQTGSFITAGGTGSVTVTGIGGNNNATAGSDNTGVCMTINGNQRSVFITSSGGNVTVNGIGGGGNANSPGPSSSSNNRGVTVLQGAYISAGGSGTVNVIGQGGGRAPGANGLGFNCGIYVCGTNYTSATYNANAPFAFISSSGGAVTVTGSGGGGSGTSVASSSPSNYGVYVAGGGKINSGGNADVVVNGTGGGFGNTSGGSQTGVLVEFSKFYTANDPLVRSTITSGGTGNVTVIGQGGGAGSAASSCGVIVKDGSLVTSGGLGSVNVTGIGAVNVSGSAAVGVMVTGNCGTSVSTITSGGGDVTVVGRGGGQNATNAWGINVVSGGLITGGGNATVNVTGYGGNLNGTSGSSSYGVNVQSVTTAGRSSITSNNGPVTVTGFGGGTNTTVNYSAAVSGFYGIYVQTGGLITAGGVGSLTVNGTGGGLGKGDSSTNYGIFVCTTSSSNIPAQILGGNGAVTITGRGGGTQSSSTSGNNRGVMIGSGGQIGATGPGTPVTIYGTGGGGGTGAESSGVCMTGCAILNNLVMTSNGGDISVYGTPGNGAVSKGIGSASAITIGNASTPGNVTLVADSMLLAASPGSLLNATNLLVLPRTAGVGVSLGCVTDFPNGPLALTSCETAILKANNIQIGNATTGNFSITDANFTGTANVTLISSGNMIQPVSGNMTVPGLANFLSTGSGDNGCIILSGSLNNFSCVTASGTNITIRDVGSLTVGTITGNGTVALTATDMTLTSTVNATLGGLARLSILGGTTIDLGTKSAGNVGLNQADINKITAGCLTILGENSNIVNSAVIDRTNTTLGTNLTLITNSNGNRIDILPAGGLRANGCLTLESSYLELGNTVSATSAGCVTISTAGFTHIDLGNGTDGGANMGLSQTELNKIMANLLTLSAGVLDLQGYTDINNTAPISWNGALRLFGKNINQSGAGSLSTISANLQAGVGTSPAAGSISLNNTTNDFTGTVTANAIDSIAIADKNTLDVGNLVLPGVTGSVNLYADALTFSGNVSAAGGSVTLAPATTGRGINLGTLSAGNLSLTQAQIDRITAASLTLGNSSTTGNITTAASLSFAGFSSSLRLNSSNIIDIGNNLTSNGGVMIYANGLNLGAQLKSTNSWVSIRTNPGVGMNLGDGTDTAANMGLSQAEISNISMAAGQQASYYSSGSIYNSAPVSFTSPVYLSASSSGGISQGGAGNIISSGNITLYALGDITLANGTNDFSGVSVVIGGNVTVADSNALNLIDNGQGKSINAVGNVTLQAQCLTIGATIIANSGNNTVTLLPTAGTAVDLGTKSAGKFGLVQADLNNISASTLSVGNLNSGNVAVSSNLTYATNLTLTSNQAISGSLSDSNHNFTQGGNVIAATGTVNLIFAPGITTQPTNQSVSSGNSATFSAAATGGPAPTVQWQVNTGSGWANVTDGTGGTTNSYTTPATTSGMNGYQYRAVYTNGVGSDATTNAVTLTVSSGSSAPSITTQPTNQSATAGNTATFSAAASGTPAPTVQWQVNDGSGWANVTTGSGGTTNSYTTPATTSGMNGYQYRAVYTNGVGSDATTNAVTLTVNVAPSITTQPVNTGVEVGQTASFTAAASGNPAPSVQWESSPDGSTGWAPVSGATSATLSFTATAGDNGKYYRAVFSNGIGSAATSNAAKLAIGIAPVIITGNEMTIPVGLTSGMSIIATGTPTMVYTIASGSLPSGVTLDSSTGLFSGTPAAGTAGSWPVTIRAANGIGNGATQNFNLKVTSTITSFTVSKGQAQRSYMRYLDLGMDSNASALALLNNPSRVQLTKADLNGVGATPVPLTGFLSVPSGQSKLSIDFGSNGLGNSRATSNADGYYTLGVDLDGNGTFETNLFFFRLFGDVNGDREVTVADQNAVLAKTTSAYDVNLDTNGDGVVNTSDYQYAKRAVGRRLKSSLIVTA